MSGRHPLGRVWGAGALATGIATRRWWTLACLLAAGCSLHQEGVRPPENRIFFPGGAVIEDGGPGLGKWLYVVNSNSDLRYNGGTVVAVNLARVRQDYPSDPSLQDAQGNPQLWATCPPDSRYVPPANVGPADRCCWDVLDSNILNCDEQVYVNTDSAVRIGNFGGRPVMQQLPAPPEGSGRRRLFVPVRGDAAIGMIDVAATADSATFSCTGDRTAPTEAPGTFPICEPQWQISRGHNASPTTIPDSEVPRLPDEPYALAVDEGLQLMYVGHLRGGGISLMDLGTGLESRTPELVQTFNNLLPADGNGSQGATSVTIPQQSIGCFGPVYVSSRYTPVVASFVVYGLDRCHAPPDPVAQSERGIAIVSTGQVLGTGLAGTETRGIEFVTPGRGQPADRAFILQRTPPAIVALSTSTQNPFATIEVCQSPTNLVQQTDADGKTIALFVTCFDAGEVYVIDPWVPSLRAIIPVGRGPVATVLPPPNAAAEDLNRAYVVGFGANNVSVVDLDPRSARQYRVIQRIGFSNPTPREVR